jgi:hypothetical protein
MATLNIDGQLVQVDDSFAQLSPEQQNATVDEISRSSRKPTPQGGLSDADVGLAPPVRQTGLSDADVGLAPAQQPAQPTPSITADIAKSTGIGLAKGVIDLAGLPGNVASFWMHSGLARAGKRGTPMSPCREARTRQ